MIKNDNSNNELEKLEQENRGQRIRDIRENELHMNKSELAKEIGISSQFLGLVDKIYDTYVLPTLQGKRISFVCPYL